MGEKTKIVVDTNVLMSEPEKLLKDIDGELLVCSTILEELDHLKVSDNSKKAFKARQGIKYLKNNRDKYRFILNGDIKSKELLNGDFDTNKNDNKILDVCLREKANLFTLDFNMVLKAEVLGVDVISVKEEEEYKGYKEVQLTDEELADLYDNLEENKYNLLENEYLLIKDKTGNIVDKRKWTGELLDVIKYTAINSRYTDKIKPRNIKQELVFDMLQDRKSKLLVIQGLHGTGKTLCMINHALSLVEKNKFEKIVFIIQNQQVGETKDVGALPGGLEQKLEPFSAIFADKVGGKFGVDNLINERKLEILPLGFIRGRSFSNSIVMMTETENTTVQHMKLLISRLEEDSILMIDGDFKQTDREVFRCNNGLRKIIECLKGKPEFALMTLSDVERSKLANLASLLD